MTCVHILRVTGSAWLNANDRDAHWSRRHQLAAEWRTAAGWTAKAAKIPPMERAHITAVFILPDWRRRDPHNLTITAKACIDGLVDAGVIADDSLRYLDGPDPRARIEAGTRTPTIELHIEERANGGDIR